MKYIFVIFLFIYLSFPFYLKIIPILAWNICLSLSIFFYAFLKYRTIKLFVILLVPYKNYIFSACFIYIFINFWALIIIILNDTYDFSYMIFLLRIPASIILYSILLFVTYDLLKPQRLMKQFFYLYLTSCCIYILFTTIMIIYPDFRMFWLEQLSMSEHYYLLSQQGTYVTRFGLAGFSGLGKSYICSAGIIIAVFLLNEENKSKNMLKIIFYIVILLIGNFYYGRIGTVLSLMCIFVNFFIMFNKKNLNVYFKLLLICIVIGSFIYGIQDDIPQIGLWLSWALNPLISFIEGANSGYISFGYSSDHLFSNMYFIPDSDFSILFGDGRYTVSDSYYLNTDVGIMRAMLFYGIIGEFLGYISLCILLRCLYVILKHNRSGKIMVWMLFFQFIFFELKEDPYPKLFGLVIAMIIAILYDQKNDKSINVAS